jgi:photosystem II stability/assembly factor-like uncharacterized protein
MVACCRHGRILPSHALDLPGFPGYQDQVTRPGKRNIARRSAVLASAAGVLLALSTTAATAAVSSGESPWHPPVCDKVDSDGSLTFTWSAGQHLTPTTKPLRPFKLVYDLDVLATPNQLLAVDYAGNLSASRDAGCSWTTIATLAGEQPSAITPAPDGSAYVWSKAYDERLYRVAGTKVTELPHIAVAEVGNLLALAVDPADSGHLRAVTSSGVVLDSADGGQTFQRRGVTPTPVKSWTVYAYDAAVTTVDLDHIVLGTGDDGVFTTRDGGLTWTKAVIGGAEHQVHAFTVAVSPVDASVVWAMCLDVTELHAGSAAQGRHIFRSTDGGRTFTAAVDHNPGVVTLTNDLPLVAHPTDPQVVYFEFGTWFANYGTDLFSYDAAHDQLKVAHSESDGIKAIAFNPAFPQVMYLGLTEQH